MQNITRTLKPFVRKQSKKQKRAKKALLKQTIDQTKFDDFTMIPQEIASRDNEEYNELILELSRVTLLDENQRNNLVRAHLATFNHIKKDKQNKKIETILLKVDSEGNITAILLHSGLVVQSIRLCLHLRHLRIKKNARTIPFQY